MLAILCFIALNLFNKDMFSEALLCFGACSTSIDENDDYNEQICINSINTCISHAADSISLKEIPIYEVRMGEQYDWIKKTQGENISVCPYFQLLQSLLKICVQRRSSNISFSNCST